MSNVEFILPDKWYIKITDDNRGIVNSWKIKQEFNNDLFENLHYKYVYYDGSAGEGVWELVGEITTQQFQEHVLGIKEKPTQTNEDFSYLKELLTKLNIK